MINEPGPALASSEPTAQPQLPPTEDELFSDVRTPVREVTVTKPHTRPYMHTVFTGVGIKKFSFFPDVN